MKNTYNFLFAGVILLSACGRNIQSSSTVSPASEKTLTAVMTISPLVSLSDSIPLKFTVYNNTDSSRTFCKWHTPFEPLISKYLDVKDENGNEIDYRGAMAKRMIPPPADSYIMVNKGDSISVVTDLRKGYAIDKPGRYSIRYNASDMSGLVVKDSVSFTVK